MSTSRGTKAWCASTTAAWNCAAAVPDWCTAARPGDRLEPGQPERHERRGALVVVHVHRDGCRVAPAASAIGVEREPGLTTASVSPQRTHSSTRVAQ